MRSGEKPCICYYAVCWKDFRLITENFLSENNFVPYYEGIVFIPIVSYSVVSCAAGSLRSLREIIFVVLKLEGVFIHRVI